MYEAVFNGQVIARSDATVVVEGNHYFPAEAVQDEFLTPSRMAPSCVVPARRFRDRLRQRR